MTNARNSTPSRWLPRFIRNDAGNVAMLFGMLLLPMLGCIGLAIDFGSILTARNKAQVAADAAALQASGVARDIIKAGDGSEASTTAALAEAKSRAEKLFKVHAEQSGLKNYTPTVSVVRTGQNINTTVNYTVDTTTYIAKLFKQTSYSATGSAVSSSTLPSYSDVYMALDISQSMGIAATQNEMTKLYNATALNSKGNMQQTKCVFGCHVPESGLAESNQAVAKRNGIQLRIDVLREATKKLITTAQMDADSAPIYQIGLYSMGMTKDYSKGALIEIAALSNNFTTLTTLANSIDLGPTPGNGYSDSYIDENLAALNTLLTFNKSIDGLSKDTAKKYAFIITDGARDVQSGANCVKTGNRCVNYISQTSCDAMKKKGIIVGVVYTTYVPIRPIDPSQSDWYQIQVVNTGVAAGNAPALKSCATPGWYYEASDATGIDAAMQKMFAQTTFAPSLTN